MTDLKQRLEKYIASAAFSEIPDYSLSEYWSHYHSGMTINIGVAGVKVAGGSGLYEPRASRKWFQKIASLVSDPRGYGRIVGQQLIRRGLRKFDMLDELVTMPGDAAFDAVHRHSPVADIDISPHRLNFIEIAKVDSSFPTSAAVKADFAKSGLTAEPTGHIFLTYYYYNILNSRGVFDDSFAFLEIGAGNGNLARLLLKRRKRTSYIVDLPKTLIGSIEFLTRTAPGLKVVLPNEVAAGFVDADLVFLTPAQISLIPDRSVSLVANVASFQEMTPTQVAEYFALADRVAASDGYFFSVNRVEKIPGGPSITRDGSDERVMRAAEFPWRPGWRQSVREICRLNRLMIRDNCELRLCRVS
ncbi:MAG: putative sugar O-methyltransferase [Rhodopseudomonas sp.]|nr:putative sugar O-methyltransferase [Rhodopseudomonas sp.]